MINLYCTNSEIGYFVLKDDSKVEESFKVKDGLDFSAIYEELRQFTETPNIFYALFESLKKNSSISFKDRLSNVGGLPFEEQLKTRINEFKQGLMTVDELEEEVNGLHVHKLGNVKHELGLKITILERKLNDALKQ